MPDKQLLKFSIEGRVAVITLDDPATMNALGEEMTAGLGAAIARAREETSARALLIRGNGRAFCAGADLAEIKRRLANGAPRNATDYIGDLLERGGNPIVTALRSLPMPSICAVNGVAAGGGVGLALAADVVIAARSAYFYLPFVPALNLVPDIGATWALAHKIGRARALGLALTGHKLSAERAEQWGLIWKCVPDDKFETEMMTLARDLSDLPGEATKAVRDLIDSAGANSFEAQVAAETVAQRRLAVTDAFREGVSAFVERRKPSFP